MSSLLDFANIATNAVYIGLIVAGLVVARRDTCEALTKAARLYWTAVGFAALAVVEDIASIPYDGPWWLLLSGATLAMALGIAVLTDNRRDRKFNETVREWWSA